MFEKNLGVKQNTLQVYHIFSILSIVISKKNNFFHFVDRKKGKWYNNRGIIYKKEGNL